MNQKSPTQSSKNQKKTIVEGVCETNGEWQGTASDDGMVCTPQTELPEGDDTEDEEKE